MLISLDPGLYTVHLSDEAGGSGIGLIEVFDASSDAIETRLINISTRARAATGHEVAIGGFVITGEDPKRVLIRASGPELFETWSERCLARPLHHALRLHRAHRDQ